MSIPKKCIIVDDEPAAHYVLVNYINQNPLLELTYQCYNAIEALNILRSNTIDLMFLDIDMPEISGLELLQTLKNIPRTILTTAYSEFALESYEYGVIDYLLKPIYYPRFVKSIERFLAMDTVEKLETTAGKSIAVKVDSVVIDLPVNDILYAQSYGNYVKIFTADKSLLASITTNQLENMLPQDHFVRVHKSYIVAVGKIAQVERDNIILNNEKIPVGITYRRNLSRFLG
ncbi:two component transcriptional regulator, LytTR family [Pedobacter sp. ok626]|uniref:LytR/AlgR family response regulator transcription factor n=1 Tax=Pedobacter sp. ok626 TaxID=1761882 RepID=UPI00088FC8A3|nr:LytTR family DNA-binding domain-containing protein [Pedobacter sp. ok626]SDK39346.1 two component transcriptional regulator, LytTR family [Pedobacter sp. ok626]